MTDFNVFLALLISSAVTITLRALPFLFLKKGAKPSKFLSFLSNVLPYAVMGMLVVYCLKGISFTSLHGFMPSLIAVAVAVVSYLLTRKTVVSITLSTVAYMLLVQLVFI